MRSMKKKSMEKLTSALMAVLMAVTTTISPVTSFAAETESSSVAIESQAEETSEATSPEIVSKEGSSGVGDSITEESTTVSTSVSEETTVVPTQESTAVTESTEIPAETTETVETTPSETSTEGSKEETKETETSVSDIETTKSETEPEIETETTEAESESETEEATEEETVDPFTTLDPSAGLTEEDLAKIDFSSKRLLVAADETVILDPEHILSSYNGVHLLQYDTETQAKYAYAYYYNKSEFVDVDTVISVADGDGSANAAVPMAAGENPIAELQAAVEQNPVKAAGAVAVIDTGVNDVANVTESVSMIGDNTTDENGHGTKMAQLVVEQNPDVSILSIKALGADGTGDVSAVYAAIQYAIDKKVSVINLSMSAVGTAENAALTSIIDAAVEAGIAVVGAAGNNGHDVRFYVPGNIESAYIVGAADENGARIASSNFGSTVDFNVVADSTSEAAAKFSGYYTVNGAVADEKLVFPTDYVKEDEIDYNGPILKHQISFYNYQGSQDDLVWISEKMMKTEIDDEYITARIGFVEDAPVVSQLNVYVDFMSIDSERAITDECVVDLDKMIVKIPASYKDANLTIRWFMPNASYQYCYDTDEKYMISNTPEKFKVSWKVTDTLNFDTAKAYVQGTFNKGFTHASDSMNHSYVNYSTDGIKAEDYFTIQNGYIASVEEYPGTYTTKSEVLNMFGSTALHTYTDTGQPVGLTFLTHFITVTRDSDGADVSSWFNTVGGKSETAPGIIRSDIDNVPHTRADGTIYYTTEEVPASLGWVFGTCANEEINGSCPSFEPGGKIICTSKDADGTAYFFYYCRSVRAQWSGGSFSITPIPDGYLRIHKSSANPTLTNGNSCYSFTNITYKVYTDNACTNEVATMYLDQYGYAQPVKLTAGTYYIKETDAANSGYALDPDVHEVTVTAGTTSDAPQTWETTDQPLNDPFGIVINKISADGDKTADLSGAYYTIKHYAKQYDSVEEIAADPEAPTPTVWVIQTLLASNGNYRAMLDEEHYVKGVSAGAVYGMGDEGTFMIPLGTITVQETQAPAGFTLEGATVNSAKTGDEISGNNGIYLFKLVDEKSGVYLKSGNALDTDVNNETAMTLTYEEQKAAGGISVQKYDSATQGKPVSGTGASLAGIKYSITNMTGHDIVNYAGYTIPHGSVAEVITTDANGYAATGAYDLPEGRYIVQERRSDSTFNGQTFVDGTSDYANYFYLWDGQSATVDIPTGSYGTVVNAGTFYDTLAYGGLYLYKYDSATNGAPVYGSGATLAGIQFAIINNNNWEIVNYETGVNIPKGGVAAIITTDANGYAATGNYALPVGDYIVKELRAGSTVNGTTLVEGTSDFANYFYYWKDQEIQVTIAKDKTGVLTNAGTLYDDLAYGGLYMLKYDSVTKGSPIAGSGATLAGIRFAVINNNNWEVVNNQTGINTPKGGVVMVIETNSDGYAATGNYALPVGDYIVKELRMDASFDGTTLTEGVSSYANYFYLWKDNQTNVSISKDDLGTLVWKQNQTFYDDLAYGGLYVLKYDSETKGSPVSGSGASLKGIRFAVINNNNWEVENFDTKVNTPKGGVVMVIETNEDGYAATGNYALPVGDYIVKELRADATVDGTTLKEGKSDYANYFYYWKDNQTTVSISKDDLGTLVWNKNQTFYDDLAYGGIKLQKYDSTTNSVPAEGSNVSLAGIKFAIINRNDWDVKNMETGRSVPKGGVIMVITTDEKGYAATDDDALPVGKYLVKELRMDATFDGTTLTEGTSDYANNDYWWKDQQKEIEIKTVGKLADVGSFYNVPVGGGIKLQKYDSTTKRVPTAGRSLEGIKFAIINNNSWAVKNYAGNSIKRGGVVMVITTNEDGYAETGTHDLPLGEYIVRELRADASFDGQQFTEGTSNYANDDYWWKEQTVEVSITEKTAGTLTWADPFYDSPVVPPVPTGIIMTSWPYMVGIGGCILVFIGLSVWRNKKKRK